MLGPHAHSARLPRTTLHALFPAMDFTAIQVKHKAMRVCCSRVFECVFPFLYAWMRVSG